MKIKNKNLMKAGFAFFCCTSLCAFFNFITLSFLKSDSHSNLLHCMWHFLVYVLQVSAAIATVYYGERLVSQRKMTCGWYPMDILPDMLTNKNISEVIFVTTDGCLFNGIYRRDDKKFHGFDGLDFPISQVAAWSDEKIAVHLKGEAKPE